VLAESLEQVIADPDGVGHRGESGVDRADAREEAGVHHVEVVELVGPAIRVEHRVGGVGAEPFTWIAVEDMSCRLQDGPSRSGHDHPSDGLARLTCILADHRLRMTVAVTPP
jgi:hypothetical protein